MCDEIAQFFVYYDRLQGKQFKVPGFYGPERATAPVQAGMRQHAEKSR